MLTGRLSTHLDSIFTKKPVSTLPNTLAGRIFMRVEIGNWYQKTQTGFILTISKDMQDRIPYNHSNNNYCSPHMSGNRLPWIIFLIDAGMPLCHYADAGVYKWPFHLNSQDYCVPWTNRCPENVEPLIFILAVLKYFGGWRQNNRNSKSVSSFFTNGKRYPRLTRKQNKENYDCETGND